MRVLVVGSLPDIGDSLMSDRYQAACRDLGEAMVRKGWSISVSTDRANTADLLVVEGARRANRHGEVIVHYHDKQPLPFPDEDGSAKSRLQFKHVHGPGNWVTGRIGEIHDADIVLLLGGGDKTAQAFHTSSVLKKPCLPLPGFGGASGELWSTFAAAAGHLPLKLDDLRSGVAPWQGSRSANHILTFIDHYMALKPYSARNKTYLTLVIAILMCAVAAWGGLFFGQSTIGRFTLFAILISSSVMGTALHWFLRLLSQSDVQASAELFWARLGAAVVEAFALFLLLLLGAVSINGNVSFLDHLSNDATFMRVAAITSIFGLAAGFMTESVSKLIVARFSRLVDAVPQVSSEGS